MYSDLNSFGNLDKDWEQQWALMNPILTQKLQSSKKGTHIGMTKENNDVLPTK